LNLPGEKIILSKFRCNAIKEEAFNKVKGRLEKIMSAAEWGMIPNFKNTCSEILDLA